MTEPRKKQAEQLKTGRTKTDLIAKLLDRLNREPERVGLPKSNMR